MPLNCNVLGDEFVGIEFEHGLDKSGHFNLLRDLGFAVESEGLPRDVGDAFDLVLCKLQVFGGFSRKAWSPFCDVDQVSDRFQWVVDLVGNGRRQPASRR